MSATDEPPLGAEVAARRRDLRTGATTGTCAFAAAQATAFGRARLAPAALEVGLGSGVRVSFPVESQSPSCWLVVNDAGRRNSRLSR